MRAINFSHWGETVRSFIPKPPPPTHPPIAIEDSRLRLAEQAVVRLAVAGSMVPSLDWFIYAFMRKEAVLTSQIEGTQATLIDLLNFEAQPDLSATDDVEEVCNYIDALTYARAELRKPNGLPISVRLLNETHQRLMHGVRGATKNPMRGAQVSELDRRNAACNGSFRSSDPQSTSGSVGRAGKIYSRDGQAPTPDSTVEGTKSAQKKLLKRRS